MPIVIYCHTCSITGKRYVGQTRRSLRWRWKRHISQSREVRRCGAFHHAIRKYGVNVWVHEVLEETATQAEADAAEQRWIEHFGSVAPHGYNLRSGGAVSCLHAISKKKIGVASSRMWASDEKRSALKTAIKAGWAAVPAEVRSQYARLRHAGLSPEERSAAAKKIHAHIPVERRKAIARRRWDVRSVRERDAIALRISEGLRSAKSPAERTDIAVCRYARMSPETKRSRAEKIAAAKAAMSPEEKTRMRQRVSASKRDRTPEQLTEAAGKVSLAWAGMSAEKKLEIRRKRLNAMSPEQRSERIKKAWVTRRARAELNAQGSAAVEETP